MLGQWEYQVGPSVGIEAGDHIWCSRYIHERITEQEGVPKPIEVHSQYIRQICMKRRAGQICPGYC
ncbi:glutamine synthetase, chloroplastic [Iris pallida]|uniref:Glutamine synthetase, chloroplastic n=1 Tax=Iris pallida TaxID=29817 RepID=A0AAX6IGG0_IRIPA|nr:glutamine synthetase, chloroplastic [Iris pallida]